MGTKNHCSTEDFEKEKFHCKFKYFLNLIQNKNKLYIFHFLKIKDAVNVPIYID